MSAEDKQSGQQSPETGKDGMDFFDAIAIVVGRWRLLVLAPAAVGALALGTSYLSPLTYTAKTTFLPPQQPQSASASALASLGALAAGIPGAAGPKAPGDQYIALMQSVTLEDRIVEQFKLRDLYQAKYRFSARQALERHVRLGLGKKDGLITVEVDAQDPTLAADIANRYVTELRRLSSELILTEAQQRRAFFESELNRTRAQLAAAQQALESSGFNPDAMKVEPKAAADAYARIKAEVTSAEVRLQTMRRSLAETAPEIQQQLTTLGALRAQLSKLERSSSDAGDTNYVGRYRDFKYQETLYDLFSRQYESARLDESREGAMIQVIDPATPPEYKSKPQRAFIALSAALTTEAVLVFVLFARELWRRAGANPATAHKVDRVRQAWRPRRKPGA